MRMRFIGIKEFRQNMAAISEAARKNKQRLIILRKNRPVFELRPLDPAEADLGQLMRGIDEAREDVRKGRVYTSEQVKKMLGL